MKEVNVKATDLVGKGASASGTELSHVSTMVKIHALEEAKEQDHMQFDNKGRSVRKPMLYARGKSLVEGIDSLCIVQALTSTWGGPKFSNSKSGNILTDFRASSKSFDTNENVRYRFAFVKVGDESDTNAIEQALKDSTICIKNYYSNDIWDVLTDEQIQMIANGNLDMEKTAKKLLLRDKDSNLILDVNGDVVYRQSFAVESYEDDYLNVIWKKGGKGLTIDKAIEIVKEKAKSLVAE
jgi:hypothetical protein